MGIVGVLAGATLGLTMHRILPGVLQKFIPFALPTGDRVAAGSGAAWRWVLASAFSSRFRRSCVFGAFHRSSLCAHRSMKMPRLCDAIS